MATLYQLFSMKAPGKQALAGRLLGQQSRTTGVAVPVATSRAPVDFYRRTNVVMSQPSVTLQYPLGARGGLAGLGAAGADAAHRIVGDVGFNDVWSLNDWGGGKWLQHITYWKLGDYQPADASLKTRAQAVFNDLKAAADLGSMEAAATLEALRGELSALADEADRVTRQHSLGTWTDAQHRERIRIFTNINNALKRLAATKVPTPPVSGGTSLTLQQQAALQNLQKQAALQDQQRQTGTAGGGTNWALYGAGAAVLVVGALVVRKMMRK